MNEIEGDLPNFTMSKVPISARVPDVVVAEGLPVPGQALGHVVESLAGLALDVAAVVLQVHAAGV